jgi:hypothetical protein
MTTVPPIKIQVSNLLGDLQKVIKNEQGQPILASPETIKARMDTCGACEFYKENRCTKCGCFMEAKSRFTSLKCPIGKW